MTLADLATPLWFISNTRPRSTPYGSGHLLWTRDGSTGTVCTVTIWYSDEISKTRENRDTRTRYRQRSASGNRLIDYCITRHGSDLPHNHLIGTREVNGSRSAIDRSAEGFYWCAPLDRRELVGSQRCRQATTGDNLHCSSPGGTAFRSSTVI